MKVETHTATHQLRLTGLLTAAIVLAALLLTACGAGPTPSQATTSSLETTGPDGVQRIVAVDERHVVFEGYDIVDGEVFPDGRIWMLERASGELRLLTTTGMFGEYFFATGAALSPDGDVVYVKVNRTNDGDNIYRIDLASGRATFITDAEAHGLTRILESSLTVSPDGERLAFSAYSEKLLDLGQPNGENFVWLMGVYVLEPGNPAGSIRLVERLDVGDATLSLSPSFDAVGRLEVTVTGEGVTPRAQAFAPSLSLKDLQRLPLERLEALEDKTLGLE